MKTQPIPTVVQFFVLCFLLYCTQTIAKNAQHNEKDYAEMLVTAQNNFHELNYKASLEKAQKVLDHAYLSFNEVLAAQAYVVLALNYNELGESDKAINILKKALKTIKAHHEPIVKFKILRTLALVFKSVDAKQALYFFNQALADLSTEVLPADKLMTELHKAETLFLLNQFEDGVKVLQIFATEILLQDSSLLNAHFHLLNGHYHVYKQNFLVAEKHYLKALHHIEQNNNAVVLPKLKLKITKALADFYHL
ncbi:hypothetical protein K5I29_05010 [Flavobacterium agricola]|uniref:Tetratricopeptide repeat protein n=1 Tax=Flavobacterium agricola TaxID=2870839 RepID=A0ABY6M413_9FLAO|nr:hypothetical protein [Flavobacterium agricola]UYW02263.1 hypothetical protein K5I29_05010 [Flavobacterium agricola]